MSNVSDEIFYLIQDKEVKIRGRYLRFSANVEGLMAKCIILLNEAKIKTSGIETKIDLKNFMFRQKLDKFQSLLIELYPDLSESYSTIFEHIDAFRKLRNKMAHCYFTWDESDLMSVTIWDFDETSDPPIIKPTKYTLEQISNSLTQSIKDIMYDLNSLATKVIERVKPLIPHMF